jgi:hypothetical protein
VKVKFQTVTVLGVRNDLHYMSLPTTEQSIIMQSIIRGRMLVTDIYHVHKSDRLGHAFATSCRPSKVEVLPKEDNEEPV